MHGVTTAPSTRLLATCERTLDLLVLLLQTHLRHTSFHERQDEPREEVRTARALMENRWSKGEVRAIRRESRATLRFSGTGYLLPYEA